MFFSRQAGSKDGTLLQCTNGSSKCYLPAARPSLRASDCMASNPLGPAACERSLRFADTGRCRAGWPFLLFSTGRSSMLEFGSCASSWRSPWPGTSGSCRLLALEEGGVHQHFPNSCVENVRRRRPLQPHLPRWCPLGTEHILMVPVDLDL